MRVTRVRLTVALLTFLLGVLFVYLAGGAVTPAFVEEDDYPQYCSG